MPFAIAASSTSETDHPSPVSAVNRVDCPHVAYLIYLADAF